MASVYRCTCGKAYNLEEGKKYKCKNCGAIMELAAAAPVASATPAGAAPRTAGKAPASRPATGAGKPPVRPSQRAAAGSARPSLRSQQGGEGAAPAPKKKPTGLYIGIGVGVLVLIGGIIAMSGGGEDEAANAAKAAAAKKAQEERAAAEASVKTAPKPLKKLTKEEFESVVAQIRKASEAKDLQALYGIMKTYREENWEMDPETLSKAILRLSPKDKQVSSLVGNDKRKKWSYDIAEEFARKAAKDADPKKALYGVVQWVFENQLDYEIDWLYIIYKKIQTADPQDYEAKVAWYEKPQNIGAEPYTGPVQEYKGKKLHKDEFEAAKRLEWKLHKETGIPFLPTEGGGSRAQ